MKKEKKMMEKEENEARKRMKGRKENDDRKKLRVGGTKRLRWKGAN